jgi:hypothetical protein
MKYLTVSFCRKRGLGCLVRPSRPSLLRPRSNIRRLPWLHVGAKPRIRSTASSAAAGFAARANSDDCGDFAGCATIALRTGVGPFDGMSLSAILLAALTLSCPRKGAARKYTESGVNLFSSGYSITSLNVTLRRIRNGHPDSLGANRKLRGPVPDGEI